MNLLDDARQILTNAGYRVQTPKASEPTVYFEDDTLLGFVTAFPDLPTLLTAWRAQQDSFTAKHARWLRTAPVKAWNVYSVFLTREACPPSMLPEVLKIEEDFSGTRKLVRTDLIAREDVERALYPLLPIQMVVSLSDIDPVGRLRALLRANPRVIEELLGPGSPETLARALEGLTT
jgi:hypothetical protein